MQNDLLEIKTQFQHCSSCLVQILWDSEGKLDFLKTKSQSQYNTSFIQFEETFKIQKKIKMNLKSVIFLLTSLSMSCEGQDSIQCGLRWEHF